MDSNVFLQNSHVEVLTPSVAAFGDGDIEEVIKLNKTIG